MTFAAQRLAFAKILSNHYSQEEIGSFYHLLTEHYFGYSKFETHQRNEEQIPIEHIQHFSEALKRLEQNEPIQYILGETEFYGLTFFVNEHTLIPRPETEELVDWIINDFNTLDKPLAVIDIGTGSGCIAVALAKELKNAKVSAIDISVGAVDTAKNNAKKNNVEVLFKIQDVLGLKNLSGTYDVIVSNPPYVRHLEKEMMQKNVLAFEPESALFVANDSPLVFYRKIAQLAISSLKEGGCLYFEINEYLGPEMIELLVHIGFKDCLIKKDIYGKDRMIRATL